MTVTQFLLLLIIVAQLILLFILIKEKYELWSKKTVIFDPNEKGVNFPPEKAKD